MAAHKQSDNWQEERSLVECNRYMLEHDIGDVTFNVDYNNKKTSVDAVQVRALKTLLLARSSVFYAMFCGELKEQSQVITVMDVEPEAFKELIRYIYTDDVHLTAHNVLAVLYAAKKYMVSTLTKKCLDYLEMHLNADTALILLEQSMFFDLNDLTSKCIVKIQSEAPKVLSSDGFANISKAALHEILKSEDMNAPEIEVFKACVSWAESQCKKKEQPIKASNVRDILGDDLFLIRFTALSVKEFSNQVVPHNLLTPQEGFKLFLHLTSDERPVDILPFRATPRGNPFAHLLMYEGPFPSKQCPSSVHQKFQCTISRDITLSKVLVDFGAFDTSIRHSFQASLLVQQGGEQKTSVNIKQHTISNASDKCPQHVVFNAGNVLIQKGNFELIANCQLNQGLFFVSQPQIFGQASGGLLGNYAAPTTTVQTFSFGHGAQPALFESSPTTSNQMQVPPVSLNCLKDNNVSIVFEPALENIIGIEYYMAF